MKQWGVGIIICGLLLIGFGGCGGGGGPKPPKPNLTGYRIIDEQTAELQFDQPVDRDVVEDIRNYSFGDYDIDRVEVSEDGKTVSIFLRQPIAPDVIQELHIQGIGGSVEVINHSPTITSVSWDPVGPIGFGDEQVAIVAVANDSDGDTLTLQATVQRGDVTFDPLPLQPEAGNTYRGSFAVEANSTAAAQTYQVTVTARDGKGGRKEMGSPALEVQPAARPPAPLS